MPEKTKPTKSNVSKNQAKIKSAGKKIFLQNVYRQEKKNDGHEIIVYALGIEHLV